MISMSDALVILTEIKLYHHPQPDDDATCRAWAAALNSARVTRATDAVAAAQRHYTTPGANPWITPGDIVAGVRALRDDRLARTEAPPPNVHPDDVTAYQLEAFAIRAAIADGTFDAEKYTTGLVTLTGHPPVHALPGPVVSRSRALEAFSAGLFKRPVRPCAVDYGDRPRQKAIEAPREVSPAEAARMEAERSRQLAAMESMAGEVQS